MKKILIIGLMAISALTYNAKAAVDLELALVIDGSGSITAADFTLQKNAYIASITNLIPIDGSVAIGVWQFDNSVQQVFAETIISSAAAKTALINALTAMTQLGGLTAIGDAIAAASTALNSNAIVGNRQIIDVSTDGSNNSGQNPATATANFLAAGGEQVNGLLVGPNAVGGFSGGTGSFNVVANDFGDFQTAIDQKLAREVGVPEGGATIAMLGLALAGLAAFGRKFAA